MQKRTTLQDLLNQKIVYPSKVLGIDNSLSIEEENKENIIIDSLFKKGVEFLKSEQYCCASAFFEMLIKFQPDHVKAKLNLSVAFSQIGDNNKAFNILKSVLEQEPDNEIAIQNIKIIQDSM